MNVVKMIPSLGVDAVSAVGSKEQKTATMLYDQSAEPSQRHCSDQETVLDPTKRTRDARP